MTILFIALGTVLTISLLVLAIFLIPASYSVSKGAVFDAPVDDVWAVFADISSQPKWRSGVDKIVAFNSGKCWYEHPVGGGRAVDFAIREKLDKEKLVVDFGIPNFFEGEYTIDLDRMGQYKTEVVVTERSNALGLLCRMARAHVRDTDRYVEEARAEVARRRADKRGGSAAATGQSGTPAGATG